ncbi:ribosome hibernation-promoting factor, HPF/YfiA family [Turneriella parva]|uniref:Ribosome hibernation promoting factor n=1 Tax=Turneriella parva (strain ATCC BAA-1111 / DSM 21527 / NCTC 11395 / H) TaxID=869212 RepID=I4B1E1_TURPD|nr:ribosome-associated translation inhibitor RaiA [Turneriella parva]AFM11098.1 sigma 54 modulation protein/ribosomal protein S30EA [Turneriella parva DSM 21527]
MEISYYFKNLPPTDAIKAYAGKKIEKLKERLHHIEGIDVRFSLERQNQFFEITVHGDATVFHLKKSDKDLYAAIDNALDVLNNQIDKYRKKFEEKTANVKEMFIPQAAGRVQDEETEIEVRDAEIKPMDDLEAVLQLRSKQFRFLMYHHVDEKRYGLVTARNDGNYSIVMPGGGGFVETIVRLSGNKLEKLAESVYPVSKFTVAEALDVLSDAALEFLAFVNEESGRLNVMFHAQGGGIMIKRPAI